MFGTNACYIKSPIRHSLHCHNNMNSSTRSVHFIQLSKLLFTVVTFALCSSPVSADGSSCMPTNCAATCSPSCPSDQVCILGTMSNCGQCPESRCISRSVVDPSAKTSTSNSSNSNGGTNGALIGGVVGGLLGAGLLLCVTGFLVIRYKRKRGNTLPFTFRGTSMASESTRTEVMSGVIPVAYIPPSPEVMRQQSSFIYHDTEVARQQEQYDNAVHSTLNRRRSSVPPGGGGQQQQQYDNPFSDAYRNSVMTDLTDDDSRRESVASSVVQTGTRTVPTHAYQAMRAKPTIMRVDTLRANGLKRSASTRTALVPEHNATSLTRSNTDIRQPQTRTLLTVTNEATEEERPGSASAAVLSADDDPFHDRHSASTDIDTATYGRSSHAQTTDSMVSGPGDGEITIFWDSNSNHSVHSTAFPNPPPPSCS